MARSRSATTRYFAEMQAAWLLWATAARRLFPELRVVFAMLAGLAPLHTERLRSRGGPVTRKTDPLMFYDTSSYGPQAVGAMGKVVGRDQLVYGSDRPVVDPGSQDVLERLDWGLFSENAARVLTGGVERVPSRIGKPARAKLRRVAVLERVGV